MQTQPARKQPVSVSNLDHITGDSPGAAESARDHFRPQVDIFLRITDDDGITGRAAGHVQFPDILERLGEKFKRIVLPQIILYGKRELGYIPGRTYIAVRYAHTLQLFAVKRRLLPYPFYGILQAFALQLGQRTGIHAFGFFVKYHFSRLPCAPSKRTPHFPPGSF